MVARNTNSKKCVLVVDNEPKILDVLSLMLETVEYDVVTASTGSHAIDLIRESSFDAVLLDLIMPGLNGEDVLKSVRTFSQVPVIVFSGIPLDPEEVSQIGADAAIPKVTGIDSLVAQIEAAIASKQ